VNPRHTEIRNSGQRRVVDFSGPARYGFTLAFFYFFLLPLYAQQGIPNPGNLTSPLSKKVKKSEILERSEGALEQIDQIRANLKIDSSALDSTAILGRLESLLEEKAFEGQDRIPIGTMDVTGAYFENLDAGMGDSPIMQKLRQQDFSVPKENLEKAKESLLSEKKKYTTVADTRLKEVATKRQSLRHLGFSQRLEYGLLANISPNSLKSTEIHPQVGYALSKKSVVGLGLRLNPQRGDYFNTVKMYFSRQFAWNFQWLTEYRVYLNEKVEPNKLPEASRIPLFTGIGSDISIRGKLYLRSAVLVPFGLSVVENLGFIKQSVLQVGLVFKSSK
jgi:hypothetical protein